MNDLKVGDRIKDNDPRMNGRTLIIVRDAGDYAIAQGASMLREFRILKRRIHTDGKPRRGGFDLIRAAASLSQEKPHG